MTITEVIKRMNSKNIESNDILLIIGSYLNFRMICTGQDKTLNNSFFNKKISIVKCVCIWIFSMSFI